MKRIAQLLISVYLVVDIAHYFLFRVEDTLPSFSEVVYESSILSAVKWMLALSTLIALCSKWRVTSFYTIVVTSITILFLFFSDGYYFYSIIGSPVHMLGILEIATLINLYNLLIKNSNEISKGSIVVALIIACFMGFLLSYWLSP